MNNQTVISGFVKIDEKPSRETGSQAVFYEHVKSGAQLMHLKNQDSHLAFGIGFRTPPKDSTGVAHIVEHTVLSGSRKFKTREPFMELLKGSLNTFLNAMTYPDMTIYPVSSMNKKDFRNLVDVYMDAVLFPAIYDRKEIFMQEGWHHHILAKDEPITYNGVVYNEMRGAYSSQETNIEAQVTRALNKGTTYDNESGGYPYDIPKLTYENFLAFHKNHYHPSNSMIYLYGDIDLADILEMLDGEYLSCFEKRETEQELVLTQEAAGIQRLEFNYPADDTMTDEEHSYLSYALTLGKANNAKEYFINLILNEILVNSESSPLKKALLDHHLGEDVISLSGDNYYMDFGVAVKNTRADHLDKFVRVVESTLQKLVDEGIDEKLVLGSLNKIEFRLREAGGTLKGIIYFIKAMSAWRYGADPLQNIHFDEVFHKIREELKDGLFENIIRERILENPVKIIAVHRPEANYFAKLDQQVEKELALYKQSLSDADLTALIEENQALLQFQTTEDTKEEKATIPHLEKSDIDRTIPQIEQTESKEGAATILLLPYATSDISYLTVSFAMDHLAKEDIVWANYLSAALGMVNTKKYSYSELNNEINIYTSGISTSPAVFKKKADPQEYEPRFQVSTSAMGDYYGKMTELMEEMLFHSDFSDGKRLREIFMMLRSDMETGFDYHGHELVMRRVGSFFSQANRYQEELSGVEFYDHLNNLLKNFDERIEEVKAGIQRAAQLIFTTQDLVVAITTEQERQASVKQTVVDFLVEIPKADSVVSEKVKFILAKRQEGLTSASGVQYVAKGYNLKLLGYEYSGEMAVLAQILSMDYLHNAIRARGGAYGAGISIEPSGNVTTYSYRDPNLASTINAYDGMAGFLEELLLDEEDVKNYIIGSMTRFNPPMAAANLNSLVLARRFSGSTRADIEQRMTEAIETKRTRMMAAAKMIDEVMSQNYLSVFGNQEKILAEQERFSEIRPIKRLES